MLQTLSIAPIICFAFVREKLRLVLPKNTQRAIICKDSKELLKIEARKRLPSLDNLGHEQYSSRFQGGVHWGEEKV